LTSDLNEKEIYINGHFTAPWQSLTLEYMSNDKISEIVSTYLQVYADDPYTEPSSELVEFLRENPDESLDVIANGLFRKPENLDFRDLDSPLFLLLVAFADLVPDVLIQKMTIGFWGTRYLYISSAAASKSSVFIPAIINLLTDRSIYIKTLVLELIIQWPHLRTPEVIPQFDKLSKLKPFQNSEIDRKLLEQARQCVASHL
jgi:hypothetical protein